MRGGPFKSMVDMLIHNRCNPEVQRVKRYLISPLDVIFVLKVRAPQGVESDVPLR